MNGISKRIHRWVALCALVFTAAMAAALPTATLAALLGNTLNHPFISYDNQGRTTYDAANDLFAVNASPLALLVSGNPPAIIAGAEDFSINISVDENGALAGGVPGDNLVVSGDVTVPGLGFVSGVLLTGKVTGFGFEDSGGTSDKFDFTFTVTGGQLASLYPQSIGVSLNSELSNFSGDFTVNFGGEAKGTLGAIPPTLAALGDRVWEDLDADGIQDCIDGGANAPNFPADGIIGNAGDAGPECDSGIPGVIVNLFTPDAGGDCSISLGMSTQTDADGFYRFDMLEPGDYCVVFEKPADDFCTVGGVALGTPQFTSQNAGNDDAVDSDANPGTGATDTTNLSIGETDLTIDAGIYCPTKVGDFVWFDDGDGIQQASEPGVEGVTVELFTCGNDGLPGTGDPGEMSLGTRSTDANGLYMFGGEPNFSLPPGNYYVNFEKPAGSDFTLANQGNDDAVDSDADPATGNTDCMVVLSKQPNLTKDAGIVPIPPNCDLELDKTCRVETPPLSGGLECAAKIAASVLEYTGPGTPSEVIVTGKDKKSVVVSSFDAATGILTVDARPGDLGSKMTITTGGVEEVIHTSCSVPYVAGQPAPLDSPKGDPSANWLVLSFVDKDGGSASIPDNGNADGMFADSCTVTPQAMPSCDTISGGKPESILFRYTGGGCAESYNDQDTKKAVCTPTGDTISGIISVEAAGNGDFTKDLYTVIPMSVAPGGTFEVSFQGKELKSNSYVRITDGAGNSELNSIHTSCSQPLAVGDVFGSLTVAGIDGQSGGADVTYQYVVTNNGDPLTGVNVTDNLLGAISGPIDLGTGDRRTFTKSTKITGTTVNTGTASALLGGEVCSASDSTTVTVAEPPVTGAECDGKVTDLVLKNLGADALVRVDQKKDGTVFEDFVPAGGEFSFSGTDKKGTLGTEISIFVNDVLNTKIHTSCSQPIGPGLVSGSFEVISGNSRNGGPLPPL